MSRFEILDNELKSITDAWKQNPNWKTPKIIHQIWVNENPNIPDEWSESPVQWKAKHPDWHYVIWDGELTRALVEKYHPEFLETYDSYPYEIQRIDTARYVFLQAYGGLYADLDTVPMENIEPHVTCDAPVWLTNDVNPGTFTNCLMLSKPDAKFWTEVLKEATARRGVNYIGKFNTVIKSTGPHMVSEVIAKHRDTICRLPKTKFNATSSEGATVAETLDKGAIIQNLRGLSWLPAIRPGTAAFAIGRAMVPDRTKGYSTLISFLILMFCVIVFWIWFWWCGYTMADIRIFLNPTPSPSIAT